MTNALDVAGYIKKTRNLQGYQSMDLQKLVYFVQAWHMAWTGRPIFDEPFEAWANGPVVRSVYRENAYGVLPQTELDEETRVIIDAVIDHYQNCTRDELIALTHADAPWIEARKGLMPGARSQRPLSGKTMLDFYTAKTLAGDNAPHRPAYTREADAAQVSAQGKSVVDRWREGLELLANK